MAKLSKILYTPIPMEQRVYSELFASKPSKSQRTQLLIIEGAIKIYSAKGLNVGTDAIAKECGLSRSLILHYFPLTDDLFFLVAKYIRFNMLAQAVSALSIHADPKDQLLAYIGSTFEWVKKFPDHARVWSVFYHKCSNDKKFLKLNTELVTLGHQRIKGMIEAGNKIGKFSSKAPLQHAKAIQCMIGGALTSSMTEEGFDAQTLQTFTIQSVLDLLKS